MKELLKKQGQLVLWIGALVVGVLLGMLHIRAVDETMTVVATVYTRLFQLLAAPTIVLAVINTLASFGRRQEAGRVFLRTLTYTLMTTVAAAAVGLVLYLVIAPGNLSPDQLHGGAEAAMAGTEGLSYADHLLSVVPNNLVRPFLEGNVLSLLLLAFAIGIALSRMPQTAGREVLINGLQGLQDLLFTLIRALIRTLPLGIVAFAAQLAAQMSGGVMLQSLGRYVSVVVLANLLQIFVVLPIFLLARGINPLKAISRMSPALLMAFFTKSSAATLPVTMQMAEERMAVPRSISRFVLPICTTINMNGCAAFILVTSLFVMQNGGMELSLTTMLLWLLVSVVSAIGNAGVPMGCYFLTLSLMSGIGAPVEVMGLILPIYTVIDMLETAENVWSDSCVCAMTSRDLSNASWTAGVGVIKS